MNNARFEALRNNSHLLFSFFLGYIGIFNVKIANIHISENDTVIYDCFMLHISLHLKT